MARTRQATRAQAQPKKIKFSEDGDLPSDAEVVDIESPESTQEPESESDSDSDEAPEEESTSNAKQEQIQKLREQEKLEQELRKQEKEKRKQRDLHFKQQQEAKRQQQELKKQEQEAQKQREEQQRQAASGKLPEKLPQELLESDDEDERSGKHLRSEHFEKEHEAMRKRMKLEKLKQLKEMRKQAVNKGPVYVQVNASVDGKRVPKAEQSIMNSKSSWFQRKSLNRK